MTAWVLLLSCIRASSVWQHKPASRRQKKRGSGNISTISTAEEGEREREGEETPVSDTLSHTRTHTHSLSHSQHTTPDLLVEEASSRRQVGESLVSLFLQKCCCCWNSVSLPSRCGAKCSWGVARSVFVCSLRSRHGVPECLCVTPERGSECACAHGSLLLPVATLFSVASQRLRALLFYWHALSDFLFFFKHHCSLSL